MMFEHLFLIDHIITPQVKGCRRRGRAQISGDCSNLSKASDNYL